MKRILLALFGIPVIFCSAQENWDRIGEMRAGRLLNAISDPQAREIAAAALRVMRDEASTSDLLAKAESDLFSLNDSIAKLGAIYFAHAPQRTGGRATRLLLTVSELPILIGWMIEDAVVPSPAFIDAEYAMNFTIPLELLGRELNEALGVTGNIGWFNPSLGSSHSVRYERANLAGWIGHQLNESLRTRSWSPGNRTILTQLLARMQAENPSVFSRVPLWYWVCLAAITAGLFWLFLARRARSIK